MSSHENHIGHRSEDVQQSTTPSNANNFRGAVASQVNPRTGKLQLSIDVPVLPGIGGLDVDLGLEYVQNDGVPPKNILGLPAMWQYRLSYIADNQIVINGRQSYTLDPSWPAGTGMKYQSLQQPALTTCSQLAPLPYDSHQSYRYQLAFLNGEQQYLDNDGRLIAIADAAGNHVLFYYNDANVPVDQTTLKQIVDTYGQIISFDYSDGNIRASFPAGGTSRLQFTYQIDGASQLTGYQDPDGRTTTIAYGGGEVQNNLVSSISYPNQLVTSVSYAAIPCITPAGQGLLDVVSELTLTYQGASRTTRYSFDPLGIRQNYTGYPKYRTQTSDDQLLMSGDNGYRYVTAVDDGVILTQHTYNNLHLELQRDVYASAAPGDLISSTVYTYFGELLPDQAFPAFVNLPAKYQMPIEVVTCYYNPGSTATCRATKTVKTYNDAGQVTSATQYTSADGQTFVIVQATSIALDPRFGQMTEQDDSDYRASGVLRSTAAVTRLSRILTSDGSRPASSQIGPVASGSFSPSRSTSYTYDPQGRILTQTFAWADHGSHEPPSTQDTFSYTCDGGSHQLDVRRTDALGDRTHQIVDTTTGFLLSEIDALGYTTRYTYDGLGRRTSKVDPLGVTTRWSYDDATNTTTVHHATGYEAYLTYDGFGKLVAHADNAGLDGALRTLYQRSYNDLGQLYTETGILGAPTTLTHAYDTRGQVLHISDALGNQRSFSYDAVAQMQSESYNGVATQNLTFDEGRVITRELLSSGADPSIVTSMGYDAEGRAVLSQVGPDGSSAGLARNLTLDVLSHPVQVATRGGDGTTMTRTDQRDLFGDIISTSKTLVAGGRSSTATSATSTYDALGHMIGSRLASSGGESYAYDANGNLQSWTDLSGNTFSYAYDACNALRSKSFTDAGAQKSLVYGYDPSSHLLTSIASRTGNTTQSEIQYTYALDGKLTSVSYGASGPSLAWVYDPATGQLSSFTDATDATTRYTYLTDGRLSTLTGAGGTATFSYYTRAEDAAHSGKLKSVSYANGAVMSYTYDGFGRIGTVTATAGGKTVVKVVYTHDPVTGNLVAKVYSSTLSPHDQNLNYGVTYQYNGLGQLTQESMTAGGQILATRMFVYDAAGNVLEIDASGAAVQAGKTTFSYDQDNRLGQVSAPGAASRAPRYDSNGNMVNDGAGRTLAWNALGQLTGLSGAGASFTYTYYPDGLRASKQAAGQTPVQFYYDHQPNANVVNEIQGGTTVVHQLAGDQRLTRSVGGSVTALFDDRKSVVASLTGQSLVSHRFGAEGEIDFPDTAGGAGAFRLQDDPFGFAGEYRDAESGYVYLRARYYDPGLMRFVSRDNAGMFNRYGYCATNPVMLFDPSGHAPWWAYLTMGLAAVASIGVTVLSGGALSWAAAGILEGAGLAMTTAVNMGIDATAAAAGAAAGDAVTAVSRSITEHRWAASQFFNKDLGIDMATGAAGAALGDAVKYPVTEMAGAWITRAANPFESASDRAALASRALVGAVSGVVGQTFAVATNELAKTHRVDWKSLMEKGVVLGAVGGAVGQFGKDIKRFMIRQVAGRRGSFDLAKPDPVKLADAIAMPAEGEPEMVAFRHAEFDADIDAPVANEVGLWSRATSALGHGENPTTTTGFVLRRR